MHHWGPWRNTSNNWGGCCISSGKRTLPVILRTTCHPHTCSYWYPCIPWRVGTMRWSRGWIFTSLYLSSFILQWISHSPILQHVGWAWECHYWIKTYSWFPDSSWCLISLQMCKGATFWQWKRTLRLHHIGYFSHTRSCRPSTCD